MKKVLLDPSENLEKVLGPSQILKKALGPNINLDYKENLVRLLAPLVPVSTWGRPYDPVRT